jgi:hypothetical protein
MVFGIGENQALDPSGFQIAVAVRGTSDGVRVPLGMKGKEGGAGLGSMVESALGSASTTLGLGGSSADSGLSELLGMNLPIVESATVELSLGAIAKVSITVAAPFDLGLRLLESGLFRVGNIYEIQLGYPKLGRFTPWFYSTAQKPSLRITGDEGLTATLNGSGGGAASLRGKSSKVYEGKSYNEIIEEVAETQGWTVLGGGRSEMAGLLETFGLDVKKHPLDVKRDKISQGFLTDWLFVQYLARTAGCDAYLSPSPLEEGKVYLILEKRSEGLKKTPAYKFVLRGNPNFKNVFPMFEFEIEPVGVVLPGGEVETSSQDIDPASKETAQTKATPETSDEATLGKGEVPTSAEKKVEGYKVQLISAEGDQRTGEFLPVSARDPRTAKDICESFRNELAFKGGINASFVAFAIPELMPGTVVELGGVGIFNSNYWISELTHNATANSWDMSIKAVNNGSGDGGLVKELGRLAEQTNDEKTPENAEAASGGSSLIDSVPEGV